MDNFTVYWMNEKTAYVDLTGDRVRIERYVLHPVKQIFAKDEMTRYEFGRVLKSRCWEEGRDHLDRHLANLGLSEYDPYKICERTHGVMYNSNIWFCFDGEDLKAEDVLIARDGGKNKGFTLVELIVVLVILAILAAALVPALMGYIDRAREKKDIYFAKACMEAAQAGFAEAYAKQYPVGDSRNVLGLPKGDTSSFADVYATNTPLAETVKTCTDQEPYIFVVATGNCTKSSVTRKQMYTIYYAIYVKEKDSVPYYYYNGEWSKKNGTNAGAVTKGSGTNELGDLHIQYYILANKDGLGYSGLGQGSFWGYLRHELDQQYNGVTDDNKR